MIDKLGCNYTDELNINLLSDNLDHIVAHMENATALEI